MVVGFKTGPRNWDIGKQIVEEDGARMCEVWFNLQRAEEYQSTLDWFARHDVKVGLHYWGLVQDNYKANLATHHDKVLVESIQQIKDTVDIGAEVGCVYVNAHPGAEQVGLLDLEKETQSSTTMERTSADQSQRIFLEVAEDLHKYAKSKGVTLTFETLPGMEALDFKTRKGLFDPGNIPFRQNICYYRFVPMNSPGTERGLLRGFAEQLRLGHWLRCLLHFREFGRGWDFVCLSHRGGRQEQC